MTAAVGPGGARSADLQGLRALAVIAVVIYHSNPELLPAGFIGVDVFFVLSGYLITGLLMRELELEGRISLTSFYLRRARRLFPALVSMLVIVYVASWLILSPGEAAGMTGSMPYAALWLSNFYFSAQEVSYFDEIGQSDLFVHTWSLGIEEQFYLIWPVLLVAFTWHALADRNTLRRRLVLGVAALTLISLVLSWLYSSMLPNEAFFLLPARAWQFGLGGLVYCICGAASRSGRAITSIKVARLCGVLLILAGAMMIPIGAAYPGTWALIPSIGATLVIIADGMSVNKSPSLLGNSWLTWIGDRSYSIYLWHFPIFGLFAAFGIIGLMKGVVTPFFLTLAFAHFSYRFIELPFWKGRLSKTPSLASYIVFFGAMILVVTGALVHTSSSRSEMESEIASRELDWRRDVPMLYQYPCDSWYSSDEVVSCDFGEADPEHTIVLFGDSIGAQWFSLFAEIFVKRGWKLSVLTKSACPIVDEPYVYDRIAARFEICETWRDRAVERIVQMRPRWVIIGSSIEYPFAVEQWQKGSSRLLERIGRSGARMSIALGTPRLAFDGPGCAARSIAKAGQLDPSMCISPAVEPQRFAEIAHALSVAAAEHSSVLIDFSEVVCPQGVCGSISDDGQIVFRDSRHLTDSFIRSRLDVLANRLPQSLIQEVVGGD